MSFKLAIPSSDHSANLTVETRPKQVKEWLDALPLSNTIDAARSIRDGLASINRQKISDDPRLKLLELYLTTITSLFPSIEELFSGVPLPLPEKNRQAANLARELFVELAYGYKIILLEHMGKRITFGTNKNLPLLIERALSALSKILVTCYQTYAPTPAGIWSEMHQLFRYAVTQTIQDEPIEGDVGTPPSNINLVYKQALLLALADPYRLMQGEVAKTMDYLKRFGNQAQLLPLSETSNPAGFFLVQLESDKPPRAVAQNVTVTDTRTDILLNTLDLARLLHHQTTRLEAGESYKTLNLPASSKDPAYIDLMRRLIRHWGIAPKRHFNRVKQDAGTLEICAGIRAIHYFLNGDKPAKQSVTSENTDTEITVMLSSSLIDQSSQQTYNSTQWSVINESAGGFALSKVSNSAVQIRVGEIIGIKPKKHTDWNIGVVRWVQSDNPQHLELGVQMLAPSSTPVSIKPSIAGESENPRLALLLPALPIIKQPVTILAPRGSYHEMRELELTQNGATRLIRATKLIQQTNSYEIFQFS